MILFLAQADPPGDAVDHHLGGRGRAVDPYVADLAVPVARRIQPGASGS
jgi:hypothetical protein